MDTTDLLQKSRITGPAGRTDQQSAERDHTQKKEPPDINAQRGAELGEGLSCDPMCCFGWET